MVIWNHRAEMLPTSKKLMTNQTEKVYIQARLYQDKLNELTYEAGGERDFLITEGNKYLKLTHNEGAFAFIDRETGDVFKPAGWRKPAKGVRYNLLHEGSLKALFSALDLYGGHLYLDEAVAAHIKVGSDIKEVV